MDSDRHSEPQEERLPVFLVILAVLIPLVIFGPLTYLFVLCLIDSNEGIFVILTLISVLIYIWLVYSILKDSKKGTPPPPREQGLDLGTQLMIGAMGAKLVDKTIEKEKKKSEQSYKDTFLWQESIREKNNIHDNYDEDW